jgi:hypothetical protein
MQRRFEHMEYIACLHHIAGIQHHHMIAQLGNNTEIVGDIKDRSLQFIAQLADQAGDLRFQGYIQGGCRFVRNQQRLQGAAFSEPKLVCIDLQPYATVQAPDREDILNVGGFSDAVFEVVAGFLASDAKRFVSEDEAIEF